MKEERKPNWEIEAAIRVIKDAKEKSIGFEELYRIRSCRGCPIMDEWREQKKSHDCCNSMKDDRIYLAWMVFIIMGYLIFIATLFFG